MPTSNFEVEIIGNDTPPPTVGRGAYLDGVSLNRVLTLALSSGSGDDQIDVAFIREDTLAAGGTYALNLGAADDDAYGVTIAADDVFAVFVEATAGTGALQLEPGVTNPLNTLLGAGTVQKIPLGAFVLAWNRTADRINVDATNRSILLRNSHGSNTVSYRLIVLARR